MKENELVSKEHDKNKTKHYAKLGATFAIKENTLSKGKGGTGGAGAGRNSTAVTSATPITPKKINAVTS